MRRLHLFEWEDQPWLPQVFRDFITDHLRYTHNEPMREPVNRAISERLAALMARTKTAQIVDLCSGGGGPVARMGRTLSDQLAAPVHILLTDLYPNVAAFQATVAASGGLVTARFEPTNATDVPADLRGIRTMFTAAHHFQPGHLKLVLADAVRKGVPIAIFEPLERTLRMLVLVGLMSFLRGLTHTHIVAPLTPGRFFWTYLLPVAPALFAWDGSVSTLRTYTVSELLSLGRSVAPEYGWDAGRFDVPGPYGPMPTTYLIGEPRR